MNVDKGQINTETQGIVQCRKAGYRSTHRLNTAPPNPNLDAHMAVTLPLPAGSHTAERHLYDRQARTLHIGLYTHFCGSLLKQNPSFQVQLTQGMVPLA